MRKRAASFVGATEGASCNQSAFKVGTSSFFFVGPGAKGQGFKAMLKLTDSLSQAKRFAAKNPAGVQVGSTGWVTVRFSVEEPIAKAVWEKWLKESYTISFASGAKKMPARKA